MSRPNTVYRDAFQRRGLLACLVFAAVLIAACARTPIEIRDTSGNAAPAAFAPPAALAPLFGFLATAVADEAGIFKDSRTGASVWVIADRVYNAASGRLCRRFYITSPQGYEGMTEGLACWDERGQWTMSEPLINLDDLGTPRLKYP